MRLLHVIHTLDPETGGPVAGLSSLVHGLVAAGAQPEVLCQDDPSRSRSWPVPVHRLGPVRTTYGYSTRLLHWLKANRTRFDSVIVHGIWQFHGLAVRAALRNSSVPYYVFTHGMLDPWFKRTYPLKHIKKCLYWPWGEYRVLRDARGVLFTCEEERLLARQSFGLYRCREVVLGYGISEPPAAEAANLFLEAHPQCADRRCWLFLGRINVKKGGDLLLRAFAQVAGGHPDLHLIVAGPDSNGQRSTLQNLSRSLGAEDRVTWPGMLTGRMKWDAIRAAEVFWLPSHQENFGVAIAEALACGVPVLISDRVNIWREIAEDQAGLIEPDSLEGAQRLARRWLALPLADCEAMRANAQECYSNRFRASRVTERLMRLLTSDLLERENSSPGIERAA